MEIVLAVLTIAVVAALLVAALPLAFRAGARSTSGAATVDLVRLEAQLQAERSGRADAERERVAERERHLATLAAERAEAAEDLGDVRARADRDLAMERGLTSELQVALTASQARVAGLGAQLDAEKARAVEVLAMVELSQTQLEERFRALSAAALTASQTELRATAEAEFGRLTAAAKGELESKRQAVEHLVAPLRDSLAAVSAQVTAAETARVTANASLSEQVTAAAQVSEALRRETAALVTALRKPQTRGAWGEMQLRRVVEVAGMLERCDFAEQVALAGGAMRPDMVVTLAGGASVVVDAKVPLTAYLEASEASDEAARAVALKQHARQVRDHVKGLASKDYASALPSSPEFVVLFIPGESFLSAALEVDPELMEVAARDKVVLATPTTLLALLRTIAYGWQQTALAEGALLVSQAGRELYDRLSVFAGHLAKTGRGLSTAVGAYNEAVGSLDVRVLPAARRLRDLEVVDLTTPEIATPLVVEADPRILSAPEAHVLALIDPLSLAVAEHLAELPVPQPALTEERGA